MNFLTDGLAFVAGFTVIAVVRLSWQLIDLRDQVDELKRKIRQLQ